MQHYYDYNKRRIYKCADKYSQSVNNVSNLMSNVFAGQKEGIENAREAVDDMVEIFLLCNYYDSDKSLPPFFALSLIYT